MSPSTYVALYCIGTFLDKVVSYQLKFKFPSNLPRRRSIKCIFHLLSQTELEDMLGETHASEEKAKKAMIDAARLADELRLEQECAQGRHSVLL